ncbi:J domain-containing protein [Chlorogloeopsis fritschii PCC 9212]|jgi:tetratricopeptide (TPR) repeat protein|uniref:Molecular chaperone DnaJ n=1 Tax=Chlorogloeopsis fritschii PCC 6912 TaxID=211165 RepID=A0A3S0XLV6_CHLFR|nr:J domain-containing protein [Chlorogloeopsis fritschii]MBF2004898.1 DnaJ domain-containing protein [Chlorogloeopsis fritschii C42_A2020_084]RUR75745.1 molecular chaperone DnaJ [Chlorogloeopsis fritschii PCC 6912]
MDLGDCYRLLGLRSGASFAEIKASYRRLVQQYHPDINPDDKKAKEKFIALTEAYKLLLEVVPPISIPQQSTQSTGATPQEITKTYSEQISHQTPQHKPTPQPPQASEIEQRLKWKTYEQLQQFLKARRFPQAIALAEALAERMPEDAEVRQWQAIAYQIWGRALIAQKQLPKAKIYLQKALKTDPHNKALWDEIQLDFQKLEQLL